MASSRRVVALFVAALGAAAGVRADVLVMRSGERVEGTLIGVRGDTVEFEDRNRRTRRYDRYEVRRIELDGGGGGTSSLGDTREDRYSRPSGMRERQVSVDAASPWTDTGIEVRNGQELRFEASGKVSWGPKRKDGPGGESGSPSNPNRPLPNRPGAALIGRIGNDLFFIGDDRGPIRVRGSGRLQLGINDDVLHDNAGSFRVVVYY